MRSIIVTGADGMGKSTLVSEFEFYGVAVRHDGGPVQSFEDAQARCLEAARFEGVTDRCVATDDPIYSKALNREIHVPTEMYDHFLVLWDPLIVFVESLPARIDRELKPHKPPELLEAIVENAFLIQNAYRQRMEHLQGLGLSVIEYNWREVPMSTYDFIRNCLSCAD